MVAQQTQLTVQAGPITAQVIKAGQGEPLVYLHGAFGYRGWPAFLERLSANFTVYAPVHPGFEEGESIEQIDDLLGLVLYHYDLLDALGLESVNVVGHFFGAMMAAEMAAICPHRIDKLVLASPGGLWLDDDPGVDYFITPANELKALIFNDGESDIAKSVMPEPEDDEERGFQIIRSVRALSTVGKFLWPIPDKGLGKRLRRITNPTLVVVGENDKIVPPSHGDKILEEVANSRLHTVSGGGHMFPLEHPDEFAEVVSSFLAD